MVILLLIILLIVNGSKVVYKDEYIVLTGTIKANTGLATIDYPENITKDNCVAISFMLKRSEGTTWGTGTVFDTSGYMAGSMPAAVKLSADKIYINIRNVNISLADNSVMTTVPAGDYNYKLILMKI